MRYGLSIKERLAEVMTIVRPETLLAWNRRMKRQKWTFDNTPKRPGRPSKGKVTEELALRMAEENTWGYVRIAGELKKLGHHISPSGVHDLLKKHGLSPCPRRKGLSWKQFIQSHMDGYLGRRLLYRGGLDVSRFSHLLHAILHPSAHPTCALRRLYAADGGGVDETTSAEFLLGNGREHGAASVSDPRPRRAFLPLDEVLHAAGIQVIKTPPRSPMCNAYAERFVRETREILGNLILLGEQHFRHVLKQIE